MQWDRLYNVASPGAPALINRLHEELLAALSSTRFLPDNAEAKNCICVLAKQDVKLLDSACKFAPKQYRRDYVKSLLFLDEALRNAGRRDELAAVWEQPVSLFRGFCDRNPGEHYHDYATALGMLANALLETNRVHEAIDARLQTVSLYRRLSTNDSERHGRDLVIYLCAYEDALRAADRIEEACATLVHTLYHYREMTVYHYDKMHTNNSTRYEDYFSTVLRALEESTQNGSYSAKTHSTLQEAIALYRQLYDDLDAQHVDLLTSDTTRDVDDRCGILIDI